MRLQSLRFKQSQNTPKEWVLNEVVFQPINLIVGRNASGKTRTLNVINALSRIVSGRQQAVGTGIFDATFCEKNQRWDYHLHFEGGKVLAETLKCDDKALITRRDGGYGTIFAEKLNREIEFQSPTESVAVFSRRDIVQHNFLETLSVWANGTFHYPWSSGMGHNMLTALAPNAPPVDIYDANQTSGVFRRGVKDIGKPFKAAIIRDMKEIGYDITEIGMKAPEAIVVQGFPSEVLAIYVQETDLRSPTEQFEMSLGMYRALSTIIHVNFGALSKRSSCVIIDDIGEGLDFERSQALIKVLVNKVKGSDIQLLMSSNDRFVMNATPLNYWTVLDRKGATVNVYNVSNSKDKFEEFRFTGLNNFDFFATDFLQTEAKAPA